MNGAKVGEMDGSRGHRRREGRTFVSPTRPEERRKTSRKFVRSKLWPSSDGAAKVDAKGRVATTGGRQFVRPRPRPKPKVIVISSTVREAGQKPKKRPKVCLKSRPKTNGTAQLRASCKHNRKRPKICATYEAGKGRKSRKFLFESEADNGRFNG